MKWKMTLNSNGNSGWIIHPLTGEVIPCDWTVNYHCELPRSDPFAKYPVFVQSEQIQMTIELEVPDDFLNQSQRRAEPARMPALAEPEDDLGEPQTPRPW